MSFEALQAKVARAEGALEARERQVAADFRVFGGCWRDAWSPPRVVVTGLAAGFLAGWPRAAGTAGAVAPARWLQLATSLAGLASSVQAAFAASVAKDAAEEVDEVTATAGVAAAAAPPVAPVPEPPAAAARASRATATAAAPAPPSPSARRHVPDPTWDSPPRPAEAATELSERR